MPELELGIGVGMSGVLLGSKYQIQCLALLGLLVIGFVFPSSASEFRVVQGPGSHPDKYFGKGF